MRRDDIITLLCLTIFIIFGPFYKRINNEDTKKILGSVVGFSAILITSGIHILHPLIVFFIGTYIITSTSRKYCHATTFVFSFLYLIFTQMASFFGLPNLPAVTRLMHMFLILKLVGLALDLHSSKNPEEKTQRLKFWDIFHYSFNYIGLLTGPYYTYKTFNDYFKLPFSKNVDSFKATLEKLKYLPLLVLLFYMTETVCPSSYFFSAEFENCSFFYRVMYTWPLGFMARTRLYIAFIFSECICTMAGFGAYPAYTKPRPGCGPTENLDAIESSETEDLSTIEYSFDTMKSMRIWELKLGIRKQILYWNMTVQYWMIVNVYKRFPVKQYRAVVTLLVSAIWHGLSPGYSACTATTFYTSHLADVYEKVFANSNSKIIDLVQFLVKTQFTSDIATLWLLHDLQSTLRYLKSVYCVNIFLGIALYCLGRILLKLKKKE